MDFDGHTPVASLYEETTAKITKQLREEEKFNLLKVDCTDAVQQGVSDTS